MIDCITEYDHASRVQAAAKQRYQNSIGEDAPMRVYVDHPQLFTELAKRHGAQVRQTQRTETLRVMEFEAEGVVYACGVAR